ncbi:YeiH family protein [Brevibacterium sp. p3-SID960]|uniref:YeiH family protein n=1 Tax=Brevibacterium sp. p3-SID960 TaxID=2916063 RepID=UPI0021A947C2|nr:YeiH family protein [Brevibacterium sp. p3-SID960]MCT1691801.1 YeiH family protein [Brevibacterium sp. p3-SID960]
MAENNDSAATRAGATTDPARQSQTGPAAPHEPVHRLTDHRLGKFLPGLAVCAAATPVAMGIAHFVPLASALLIAIILGIMLRNIMGELPGSWAAGMQFSAKKILRLGIILLGAQLVLGDIMSLGWKLVLVVIAVVAIGMLGTIGLGRLLGMGQDLSLLIGCGFSICGAAAIAGVESTVRARKEDVAAAIALVVLFGTLMIAAVPLIAGLLGLGEETAGMWAGASTHEVAQVVAIGGIIGPEALKVAVVVKLARVLMLAPIVAILALSVRRTAASTLTPGPDSEVKAARPPMVPLFIIGFLAMAIIRTLGWLPDWAVTATGIGQTIALTAAMFALGSGVHIKSLIKLGFMPVLLATLSTLIVAGVAGLGIWLAV